VIRLDGEFFGDLNVEKLDELLDGLEKADDEQAA
jgi:hypothetical protein